MTACVSVPGPPVGCFLAASILAGVAAPGRAPESRVPPSAPRVTSRIVEVSVVAEDKQGRPVVDLKAEELALSDGGRPEQIVSFTARPVPSAPARARRPGTFTNRLDGPANNATSVTAILFDGLNTPMARQSYARQQVLAFLRQVEPGNAIALYTLGRGLNVLHELTRDPQPVIRALEQYRGELSAETSAAPLDPGGTGLERFGSWLDELETNLIEHYAKDRALRTLRSLVAIANHLEKVPGRKNLVWVSGSFPVWIGRDRIRLPERPDPREQNLWPEIDRAARALSRSNLAVYPVDARGLMAPADYEPGRASISREMQLANRSGFAAMRTLAERTGGAAFYNDNDLGRAFRRAAEDSRVAYRLGYQPSHDEWNGSFREIRIAVARPGVRLRYRRGYFAQPDEPGDDWYRSGVLGAAMWSPVDATGIGLSVRPFPAAPDTLDLDIRIEARDVSLQPVGDGWQGRLDVWLVQLGASDELLDTVSHVAGLSLDRANFEQIAHSGEVPLVERLKRDPKTVRLRVLVRDVATGALGSVSIPIGPVGPRPPG
jgi:VWFA-related protein